MRLGARSGTDRDDAPFHLFCYAGYPAGRVVAEPEGPVLAFQGKLCKFFLGSEVLYSGKMNA